MAHTFNFDTLYPGDQPFAVVFDVETTGLIRGEGRPTKKKLTENDRDYPRIVSLSWIVLSRNYRAVRNGSHIIWQEKKIPKKVIEIHGITDAIAKENGRPLDLVLEQFTQDIAECDYFVGFNVMFDKYVVEADCIRCGLKSPFFEEEEIRCDGHGAILYGTEMVQAQRPCQGVQDLYAAFALQFPQLRF